MWSWGELGEPGCLLCCFALLAMVTSRPLWHPLVPPTALEISCRVCPALRAKCISAVPAFEFADNVLYNLTRRVKAGQLWEVNGSWPGSVALFLCLECQLPHSHGHTFVLHPYQSHWAQLQLVLPTPTGMLTKSVCSP